MSDNFKFQGPDREGVPGTDFSNSTDRLIDLVEQTRSNLLRTQRRIERNERQYESLMRHIQALWLFVGIVAVGGAALSWYEFSTLSAQPRNLSGQIQLHDSGPIDRKPVENLASNSVKSVTNVPAETPQTQTPLALPVIPQSSTDQVHAAANANLPIDSNADRQSPGTRNGRADISKIDKLSDGIPRLRVDFAVTSNKTEQISPGLYLTVFETNVRKQAVDASLQIASDGHTVRILGQEAEKVLIFGRKKDPRPIALVFTHVEPNRVSGYLMLPPSDSGD